MNTITLTATAINSGKPNVHYKTVTIEHPPGERPAVTITRYLADTFGGEYSVTVGWTDGDFAASVDNETRFAGTFRHGREA